MDTFMTVLWTVCVPQTSDSKTESLNKESTVNVSSMHCSNFLEIQQLILVIERRINIRLSNPCTVPVPYYSSYRNVSLNRVLILYSSWAREDMCPKKTERSQILFLLSKCCNRWTFKKKKNFSRLGYGTLCPWFLNDDCYVIAIVIFISIFMTIYKSMVRVSICKS